MSEIPHLRKVFTFRFERFKVNKSCVLVSSCINSKLPSPKLNAPLIITIMLWNSRVSGRGVNDSGYINVKQPASMNSLSDDVGKLESAEIRYSEFPVKEKFAFSLASFFSSSSFLKFWSWKILSFEWEFLNFHNFPVGYTSPQRSRFRSLDS